MASEEERLLESQLEYQLQEQRDSLIVLEEALTSDPMNPDLISVHEELALAVSHAEEGLLHLKRARLLQEADAVLQASKDDDVKAEPLDPTEYEQTSLDEKNLSAGSKCRFRFTDGCWYNGQIIRMESPDVAKISFLVPTSEKMLMCKFFLQKRCRFGNNCRLSHGVDIPLSSLKEYVPTSWERSLVGSAIFAASCDGNGLWREAELESWDDNVATAKVVFRDDGSSASVGANAISLSKYADNEDSSSCSSGSEDDSPQSPDLVGSSSTGIQTETVIFAKWENHTRGIASKMMASMGYREGMGLGASGQGMLDPVSAKLHPPGQSLAEEREGKKRNRGGKRKHERKPEEQVESDVFSFINSQLAAAADCSGARSAKRRGETASAADRRSLVVYDDEVKELRTRVEKLEEMVERNKKDKAVCDVAVRKLNETRNALVEAEAAHASATNAVARKEREKKWLKF